MCRALIVSALLAFSLAPARLAAQQPYPRLARVVGAIRTAALVSTPAAPPHSSDPLDFRSPLPPLANRPGASHRKVLRVDVTERLQFRATGDWVALGPVATMGFRVRF